MRAVARACRLPEWVLMCSPGSSCRDRHRPIARRRHAPAAGSTLHSDSWLGCRVGLLAASVVSRRVVGRPAGWWVVDEKNFLIRFLHRNAEPFFYFLGGLSQLPRLFLLLLLLSRLSLSLFSCLLVCNVIY